MSAATPQDLLRSWERAEAEADVSASEALIDDGFRGVGPVGYVLDRDQWLGRHAGGLEVGALTLTDVEIREYDAVAVAIAVQTQSITYRGRPNDGRFRVSFTMRRVEGSWRVLGVHLSGPLPDVAR